MSTGPCLPVLYRYPNLYCYAYNWLEYFFSKWAGGKLFLNVSYNQGGKARVFLINISLLHQERKESPGIVFPHNASCTSLCRLLRFLWRLHIKEQSSKTFSNHNKHQTFWFHTICKKKEVFFLLVWNFSKRSGSALMCNVWQPMWKVQAFLFQPSLSAIWTRWDYIHHPPSFLTLTTGYWMEKRQQQWWGIVWTEKYLRLWQRHRDLEGLCQEQDIHPGGHDMGEWNFCQRLWRSSGIWEGHGVCEFLPMDILDDDHHVWLLSHPGLS